MRLRSSAPLLAVLLVGALGAAGCSPSAPLSDHLQSDVRQVSAVSLTADSAYVLTADSAYVLTAATVPSIVTVSAVHASQPAPQPDTRHLTPLVAFAGAVAGKRKAQSRRARGVAIPDVPMFLDSDVHVMREGELVVIRGGVLVEDTELEDEEIADLVRHKVLRPATVAELSSLEQKAEATASADLAAQQDADFAALSAAQDAEMAAAKDAGKSESQLAKLSEKHAAALTALREQHAAALNG